jgi:hypothetical protein
MLGFNKENEGATKSGMAYAYYDPVSNSRNDWRIYRCALLLLYPCFAQLVLAKLCKNLSPLSSCFGHRGKQTFGRWSRKDGKAVFVAGIPPPFSAFKQPVLELFSWQEFAENGRDVRVAI